MRRWSLATLSRACTELHATEKLRQQRLSLWTMSLPPHYVEPSLLPGPLYRDADVAPPFPDSANPRIATALGGESLAPSGMPKQAAMIAEILALEGAPAA